MSDIQSPKPYCDLASLYQLKGQAAKLSLKRLRRNKALLTGPYHSQMINRGMEFKEVRQYQSGDDIRNIDWRVTARTQSTHTKCFEEEKEKPIITLLDQRSALFFGSQCFKSVYGAQLCALINWAAISQGDRTGGIVAACDGLYQSSVSASKKNISKWFQQIVDANHQLNVQTPETEPSLQDMIHQLQAEATPGHELYIISDFHDLNEECRASLYRIARHCIVTLIWLVDPLDQSLPRRTLNISDGQRSSEVAYQKSLWQQYENSFITRERQLYDLSAQAPIRIILAEINQQNPVELLKGLYGKR